jgi:hypothetical protein
MEKTMADVEKAQAILEAERTAVLSDLGKWKARERKARSREAKRREKALAEMHALLMRGKAAGVPVVELAEAVGISRQMAHRLIREAQPDVRKDQRQEERAAIESFLVELPEAARAAFKEFLQARREESGAELAARLGLSIEGKRKEGGRGRG